ncbi:MAG: ABC transporter ATP-binding protein [Lachnospiraceae bacterium]|nr:ABC transporter ATP-binding protein [Lachnospiraceae bacterium]
MEYENAIEIKDLVKRYDGFTLDNVSFTVPRGSIMGFIGQNGAGKTTTINCLLNLIKKDGGEIKLLGMDMPEKEYEIKKYVSAVFDELPFNEELNANVLDRILSGVFSEWDHAVFSEYLERLQLPSKKKFKDFSKGMKMKLQIAAALSHHARVLIMDEATTGLDPVIRNEILDIFLEFLQDEENAILMSSHITSDLEKVADRVSFIDKGKLLLCGVKDDILDAHGIMKIGKKELEDIDRGDYISARVTDFGADLMVADRAEAAKKYSGALIEKTTLEEIMLFYVNRSRTFEAPKDSVK